METIKRLKVQEFINKWNDDNPIKIKKTAGTVGKSIGVAGRSLSLWNTGTVIPKQIQALYDISVALDCSFDDLFEFAYDPESDKVILKRIALKAAISIWNETRRKKSLFTLSEEIDYSVLRLRKWNNGELPFPIMNFFNFCKNLEIKKPFETLEF